MATQVEFTFQNLPSDYCFTTPQQFALDIAGRLSGSLAGESKLITLSKDAPTTDNQDRAWLRLNSDGSPDRLYYYWNGQWTSLNPTPPLGDERRLWIGNTSDLESYDGGVAGVAVTFTTGPMWEVDTAFAALFPIGVGTTPNDTVIGLKNTGGEDEHTLSVAEMPSHTHNAVSSEPPLPGTFASGARNLGTVTSATGGDKAHNNLPPYYGVYFIKRTLRRYYVAS